MMRLTKKSSAQLLNYHSGTGIMFLKTADKEYMKIHFWLGKDNKFHTGRYQIEIGEFLDGFIPEIIEDLGGKLNG